MAYAIKNRFKWELAKGDLEEYKKLGGAIFEGTNEEVERHPKFLAILDKVADAIKPKIEKEKKSKKLNKKSKKK